MLHIDGSARTHVSASPETCRRLLTDVPAYPSWSTLIENVELLREGPPPQIRLSVRVLGLPVVMDCVLEHEADGIRLRRLPYDAEDDETYMATWTVEADGAGAVVGLHVVADIDAPGPAGLLRGRVTRRLVDDVLEEFARAASRADP